MGSALLGQQLAGQSVVVTGANRGLGRSIAMTMANEGARLVLTARDKDSLGPTLQEIQRAGGDAIALACDVAEEGSVDQMAEAAHSWAGQVIDCVVANAGIAGPTLPMHEMDFAQWRECISTDLDGVFLTFRRFIPGMIAKASGSLIAISSMTGKRPLLNRTPYAAAKMGVIGLVRTLAHELGPHGIRVNTICPGAVNGPRIVDVVANQAKAQGITEEAARQQLSSIAALGRFVEPNEVADACVFLASSKSSSITGEDLNVTAGAVMY